MISGDKIRVPVRREILRIETGPLEKCDNLRRPFPQRTLAARQGSITVLMTAMLVAILMIGALAISLAQIQSARVEAQIAADCSSISGATLFGEVSTSSVNTPELLAQDVLRRNRVMGVTVQPSSKNVTIGRAILLESGKQSFEPNGTPANAVAVTVKLGEQGGASELPLMYSFLFDRKTFGIERTSVSAKVAHDVALVLDRSSSMNARLNGSWPPSPRPSHQFAKFFPHPTQSRWGIMLNSIDPLFEAFSRSKIEERFALVTFGSKRQILLDGKNITFEGATIDVQLTNNSQAIKNTLTHMWDDVPMISGQTWIDFGLDFAMTELTRDTSRDFAFKTVILLTDGLQFPVTQLHYRAAERLAAKGIIIHTIAFSKGGGFREMQDIAKIGGGKAFFAPDQASLITAFEEVATMSPIAIID